MKQAALERRAVGACPLLLVQSRYQQNNAMDAPSLCPVPSSSTFEVAFQNRLPAARSSIRIGPQKIHFVQNEFWISAKSPVHSSTTICRRVKLPERNGLFASFEGPMSGLPVNRPEVKDASIGNFELQIFNFAASLARISHKH
jgi:hypothetical protein